MDNPLLIPYIGEKCPWCGEEFPDVDSLRGTMFGADARPVHRDCWNAYTGDMVRRVRELCERLWGRAEKRGTDVYQLTITQADLEAIREFVRPARNR